MLAQPGGELGFVQFAGGEGEDGQNTLSITDLKLMAVNGEEQFAGNQRGALVAIDKRVIPGYPEAISRRECRNIWITVRCEIFGPSQGRFEQADISNATGTPMLGQLLIVSGDDDSSLNPDPITHH